MDDMLWLFPRKPLINALNGVEIHAPHAVVGIEGNVRCRDDLGMLDERFVLLEILLMLQHIEQCMSDLATIERSEERRGIDE